MSISSPYPYRYCYRYRLQISSRRKTESLSTFKFSAPKTAFTRGEKKELLALTRESKAPRKMRNKSTHGSVVRYPCNGHLRLIYFKAVFRVWRAMFILAAIVWLFEGSFDFVKFGFLSMNWILKKKFRSVCDITRDCSHGLFWKSPIWRC